MINYLLMYDERDLAEQVIKNGFEKGTYNRYEGLLVAKYFRQILGYGDVRVKNEIGEFCHSKDPFFYPDARRRTVRGLVADSNYALINYTDPIDIRELELEKIKSIRNFKLQKISLGILAIAKRNFKYSNGYLNRYFWKDVKKTISAKHITNTEVERSFCVMKELEMVYPAWNTNSHKILFIDDASSVVFHITQNQELTRLSSIYKEYRGGDVYFCSECGKEIIRNSNRHRMCDECWRQKDLESTRKRVKKHYYKNLTV